VGDQQGEHPNDAVAVSFLCLRSVYCSGVIMLLPCPSGLSVAVFVRYQWYFFHLARLRILVNQYY